MHTLDFRTPQSSSRRFPILALGTTVGTLLPLHVPEGWGGGGREGGRIGAAQTSNSEHEFIFYGVRVPNSRIKLDKKDSVRVLVTRCRLPGVAQGLTRPGPPITLISLRSIKFRPFLLYLVRAELSPPVCDIPTGG